MFMEIPTSHSQIFQQLAFDGARVLQTRKYSGTPLIYDTVASHLYHKWVMDCIGRLRDDAPEHVAQIKAVYKPDLALYHQAEQIFAILCSAIELLRDKGEEKLSTKSVSEKPPAAFSLEFLNPKLVEKCADHFRAAKYDDCILNAAKVVEVTVRDAAGLPPEEVGVNLMRKAFNPNKGILKFSDVAAEQEAAMNLYCGFIGFYKNPHSHKFLNVSDPLTAFEILSVADRLCAMIADAKKRD